MEFSWTLGISKVNTSLQGAHLFAIGRIRLIVITIKGVICPESKQYTFRSVLSMKQVEPSHALVHSSFFHASIQQMKVSMLQCCSNILHIGGIIPCPDWLPAILYTSLSFSHLTIVTASQSKDYCYPHTVDWDIEAQDFLCNLLGVTGLMAYIHLDCAWSLYSEIRNLKWPMINFNKHHATETHPSHFVGLFPWYFWTWVRQGLPGVPEHVCLWTTKWAALRFRLSTKPKRHLWL